jgi:hypothetical protein
VWAAAPTTRRGEQMVPLEMNRVASPRDDSSSSSKANRTIRPCHIVGDAVPQALRPRWRSAALASPSPI